MFDANLLNFGSISFATSAPTSTGNVFSDWVTGQASSAEQDSPYTTHLSTWHYALFVQDNYRITPRFTANLGMRWDICLLYTSRRATGVYSSSGAGSRGGGCGWTVS